jgi:hypothetical protein
MPQRKGAIRVRKLALAALSFSAAAFLCRYVLPAPVFTHGRGVFDRLSMPQPFPPRRPRPVFF